MKNLLRYGILGLLLFLFIGAGMAQKVLRVVSLAPSITTTLQQLDADPIIMGRTSYCPAALNGKPSVTVGNVLETNIEKIIALRPDLVFCMAFTKAETLEKLRKAGIKVKEYQTPKSFEEICEQTLEIGSLCGFESKARLMVDAERKAVATLREEFRNHPPYTAPPSVFFQIGDNPLFPVIEGTYMNQYLSFLGLTNIVTDYKGGGISHEYVVAKQPDIIFLSLMSGLDDAAAAYWKKFENIPAVREGRIVLVDDSMACCPTPVFFRKTLEFIAAYLRKM